MKLNSVMIGSAEPKRLVGYYTALFGAPRWEDGNGFAGWDFGDSGVAVGPHDKVTGPNSHPGRVIWNLETADFQADYDRFVAAGAVVVQEPYNPMPDAESPDTRIATFSDPDGNYFQLMTPMMPE